MIKTCITEWNNNRNNFVYATSLLSHNNLFEFQPLLSIFTSNYIQHSESYNITWTNLYSIQIVWGIPKIATPTNLQKVDLFYTSYSWERFFGLLLYTKGAPLSSALQLFRPAKQHTFKWDWPPQRYTLQLTKFTILQYYKYKLQTVKMLQRTCPTIQCALFLIGIQ